MSKLEHSDWFVNEVHTHGPALRAYLRGQFPAVRDVDDVVQESYLRVWRARLNQPVGFSKSFLFQVARRVTIDLLRRQRVAPITETSEATFIAVPDQRPDAAEIACTQSEIELLVRAIDAMPARQREVMILRKIDGLSQKEIAQRLGLSELTVQVHVVRGLRRLEEFFRAHGVASRAA
jgi:RNA polymerase sigma-70 factor (ECF subfamily)